MARTMNASEAAGSPPSEMRDIENTARRAAQKVIDGLQEELADERRSRQALELRVEKLESAGNASLIAAAIVATNHPTWDEALVAREVRRLSQAVRG